MKKTKTKINKKKLDIVMIKTCILLTAVFFSHYAIYQAGNETVTGQGEDYSTINHNHIMQLFEERREAHRAENAKLDQYDDILSTLGTMGQEIKKASIEFGVDNDEALLLMGLSIGIANASQDANKAPEGGDQSVTGPTPEQQAELDAMVDYTIQEGDIEKMPEDVRAKFLANGGKVGDTIKVAKDHPFVTGQEGA